MPSLPAVAHSATDAAEQIMQACLQFISIPLRRSPRLTAGTALAVAALCLLPAKVSGTDAEMSKTAESLSAVKQLIAEHYAALKSLKASVRSWHVQRPNDIVGSVLAARGEARYESVWHGAESERNRDPFSIRRVYIRHEFNVFQDYERRYEVTFQHAAQPYISKVQLVFLYECLGWWPPDDTSVPLRPGGQPLFLPDILNDQRLALLSEYGDEGDERILEIPGVVKLWVDCERGCVERRQQLGASSTSKTVVLADFTFSDFHEYDGVWLPKQITRRFPKREFDTMHEIEYSAVNHVADELFEIDLPPGTLIYNRDTDGYSQKPGGLDHLEAVVARIPQITAKKTGTSPKTMGFMLMVVASGYTGFVASNERRRRITMAS